jgi:Calcium/calmodulin dependent protein kinase II association domain
MTSKIFGRTLIFILVSAILPSCSNHHLDKMTEAESNNIAKDIKAIHEKLTEYSEKAELDSFISCYDNSSTFLHFSSDGKMRNFEEFKKICTEYYNTLKQQKILTITEKLNVINNNLVILGWTGNIIAQFKNGDTMKLNNYSITSIFKNIDNKWKVIQSHESGLPPEIIKKDK